MVADDRFFIEVDSCFLCEKGQAVSGDVCLQRRYEGRSIIILSDGAGSGVKANVVAEVIASMAMNYTVLGESALHAAQVILETFVPGGDSVGRNATLTILDIRRNGEVHVAEFENPHCILLRNGREKALERKCIKVGRSDLYTAVFVAEPEDRIILLSDGVTLSGRMTRRLPDGWGRDGAVGLCADVVGSQPTISAHQLCRDIVARAELNDLFAPKNDMTCAVVYFRQPRRILVCTGPPYNDAKDDILADMVAKYSGSKLICGGTTAQIISRELSRPLNVILERDPAGLPPTASLEGVDLVTEGVLTLSKVKTLLENSVGTDISQKGTDGVVARMLLEHDIVEFVVGTRINPAHQDPNLPVELELRRNLIKGLAQILENKFMKDVKVQYI